MPSANSDSRRYQYLSVQDLLQAQQIFHSDLFDRDNVVATAVGRYRRRVEKDGTGPKTLANTRVDRWSWPALLVFVNHWEADRAFAKRYEHYIPPQVTLPDRRKVPTCVILVEREEDPPPPLFQRLNFPTSMIGGGFPVVRTAQQEDRAGSLGCLVSDGANVFALTNRHVAGPASSEIFTFFNGKRRRIGRTYPKQVTKLDIDKAFPGFEAAKGWTRPVTFSNVDTALIEVDDVNEWTAQVYGIGELGELYDVSADTLTLDIIGTPVCAFGAASGNLRGEIMGLFYRYKTVGSYGYVSDLLIGPRDEGETLTTIPGDSGTIWCLDSDDKSRRRPLAIQWGGHVYGSSAQRYRLALATSLSTALRALDVDIIVDWNTGHTEYWGAIGHFKVAASACSLVAGPAQPLFNANLSNIAVPDKALKTEKPDPKEFAPLADVADLVWRNTRPADEANHFADMDQVCNVAGKFKGKTLLDLTLDAKNVDPNIWVEFYTAIGTDDQHFGALPFRVWQMFDSMVADLKKGTDDGLARYLCTAGLMAHYVGDACQPLHVSFLHHGRSKAESGVHSTYETQMLSNSSVTDDLVQGVKSFDFTTLPAIPAMNNGFEAARQVIELMRRTIKHLPPMDVIDAFNASRSHGGVTAMWKTLQERTIHVIADGSRTLAAIWESAFAMGNGTAIPASRLKAIDRQVLKDLYNDPKFVPSSFLPAMAPTLNRPGAAKGKLPPTKKPAKSKKHRKTRRPAAEV